MIGLEPLTLGLGKDLGKVLIVIKDINTGTCVNNATIYKWYNES